MDFIKVIEQQLPMEVSIGFNDDNKIETLTADVLFKNNKVVYLDTFWCADDTILFIIQKVNSQATAHVNWKSALNQLIIESARHL